MPETPMNEDHGPELWKNNIWRSRKILPMEAESVSQGMKELADPDFRFGIRTPHCRHITAALIRSVNVCQSSLIRLYRLKASLSRNC